MERNKFLEKARKIHGYKYKYPNLSEIVKQFDYIEVEFGDKTYTQRVIKHLKGSNPEKKTIKKTTEEFIKQSNDFWSNKYDYTETKYINARTKVKIIYEGIVYEQYPNNHIMGCPVEGYLDQNIFIKKAKNKWGIKYDYSLVIFKNANTKVKIILNDVIYEQSPHNHLKYSPEKVLRLKTTEEFINQSKIIHDGKYSYEKSKYLKDRGKLTITCPIHGDFDQVANSHLSGKGCHNCNESRGEREIAKFLKKFSIKNKRQHKFHDCKNKFQLPFDFYLPDMRTAIEFDGRQHYQPIDFFGGVKAFEILKINDGIKNEYCEYNYINLIRIRYDQFDDIYQILWENLRNYIKTKKTH
jgi:hypothetical protein